MIIEINELTLDNLDMYNSKKYPKSGIYKVYQNSDTFLMYIKNYETNN